MGNERRYSLDALRIMATILIIFHHLYALSKTAELF